MVSNDYLALRRCLREPIQAIVAVADLLHAAMDAHLAGDRAHTIALIAQADLPEVAAWQASIWGKGNDTVVRKRPVDNPLPYPPKNQLAALREPTRATKRALERFSN
jgi:hypothetical protein